ncbi:MAG: hypothetical protein H6707_09090 [Deltaproteobacteria bacterium]|nr:hypothetical protein [Deltaproteobacteria bacterium]
MQRLALIAITVLASCGSDGRSNGSRVDGAIGADGHVVLDSAVVGVDGGVPLADLGTADNGSVLRDARPPVDATPAADVRPVDSSGGGCFGTASQCVGLDIKLCESSVWKPYTCNALCQQAGYTASAGCGFDAQKGRDSCLCHNPPQCTDGEQRCDGNGAMKICSSGRWSTITCVAACQGKGMGPPTGCSYQASLGQDACTCSLPPCTHGETRCSGTSAIELCDTGVWKAQTCNDSCQAAGFGAPSGCGFDSSASQDRCHCWLGQLGDPCSQGSHCRQGVCIAQTFCTQVCSNDSECGTNSNGRLNVCEATSGGTKACFPTCSSSADCAHLPSTTCQPTGTPGKSVCAN